MTKATIELIDQLCGIIDKSKYLILSGTMAVGKTYLANLIAEKSCEAKYCSQGIFNKGGTYEIETELISIHPSFYYEDFVNGIIIDTESGNINFHYADKVFLTLLKKANKSWEKKEDKKYFLILDDISRGAISGILGDMLPLIEPHGQTTYKTVLSDGETISVSPNVYIIATRSTLIDSVEQMNYGFLRHFYEYQLNNDYMYMCDSATDVYSDYDMSANAMFYRTKRIVTDYLRHRYQMSSVEKERYVIGHGMYKDTGTAMIARNQIIPLLRQYVKDNVLAKTANVSIAALQKLVDGQYSKDRTLADVNRIVLQKTGITADSFRSEGLTHQPLVNLVSRIKEQGLVDDTDIANDIMFNPQVVVRKKAKLDKVERDFPTPGYLYIEKSNRDIYTYGTTKNKSGATKRPRFFYSGSVNDAVSVDGIDYAIASEMQPGEYSRWYEELDSGNEENERYSSSPNSIMFRILRSYYRALSKHYGGYLSEYPGDENIARLKAYAEQEYKHLVSESRKLHPEVSDEKEVNAKANDDFRDVIHDLVLFWKDRGETISVGGQTILVEGVYKVDSSKRYEEYSRAMETLGIHQMIMQGPPGTSKTYSAREYLKYEACKVNGREISDSDLDALQIMDYKEGATISSWAKDNVGKTPGIAWDIVQFHPSYGYEDFVRGIEVGTIKTEHLEQARGLVRDGDYEALSMLYDSVPNVLSELIRTAFVAREGNKFAVADFSAIEARVLSWLAGEMWRTEVFVNKGDIYCASASAMFGVPVEKHGQNAHLRQKGKIAELALGYGGAVGALKSMGAIEMGLAEEELQPLVDSWRAANPNIVKFWWDVDRAVKTAVKQKKQADVNGIRFFYQSGMLFIQLPSGRRLAYVKPRMGLSRFDSESVTYEGVGGTKKWERIESYGPKFVENIVQAISRDILCYAMRTLSHCMICAHVHDELIIECREDVSLDAICEQMGRIPPWAEGLVLRADGYCTPFYKKD